MNDLLYGFVVAQTKPTTVPVPGVNPDSSAPGGALLNDIIDKVGYLALGFAVLAIVVGVVTWGLARMGNNPKAQGGAGRVVMTGAAMAFIVGIATWAVTLALGFGQGIE